MENKVFWISVLLIVLVGLGQCGYSEYQHLQCKDSINPIVKDQKMECSSSKHKLILDEPKGVFVCQCHL